jgi:hypothetical protein
MQDRDFEQGSSLSDFSDLVLDQIEHMPDNDTPAQDYGDGDDNGGGGVGVNGEEG